MIPNSPQGDPEMSRESNAQGARTSLSIKGLSTFGG